MDRHLRLMRLTTFGFAASVAAAAAVLLLVPSRPSEWPGWVVTAAACGAALWVGFTANRDAQARLDRIKRRFAVDGDPRRLLAGLRLVNLAVDVRLEVMVAAAVVADVWGASPAAAWGVLALAAVMLGMSWPTEDKSLTLLQRAREERGRESVPGSGDR
jgi:hypothetical protein